MSGRPPRVVPTTSRGRYERLRHRPPAWVPPSLTRCETPALATAARSASLCLAAYAGAEHPVVVTLNDGGSVEGWIEAHYALVHPDGSAMEGAAMIELGGGDRVAFDIADVEAIVPSGLEDRV